MIRSGPKMSHTQVLIKKWEPEILKWEQSGLTQPEYCKRESLSLYPILLTAYVHGTLTAII